VSECARWRDADALDEDAYGFGAGYVASCAGSKDAGALVKIVLDWKASLWIVSSTTEIMSKYQTVKLYTMLPRI